MEIESLYMEFLKANYPDVASRLETLRDTNPTGANQEEIDKAKAKLEEEFNAIANDSERKNRFQIWEKVPPALRARYDGKIPPDIMEAAERDEIYVLREMEYHPEKRNVAEVRAEVEEKYGNTFPQEILDYAIKGAFAAEIIASAKSAYASARVAGYTESSSLDLARHYMDGQALEQEGAAILADKNLSETERREKYKEWVRKVKVPHQQKKHDIIMRDWGGDSARGIPANQPEKLLIHSLGKFNRGRMDKDDLVALMAKYQLNMNGRQEQLLEYLQRGSVQAKLGHFNDETLGLLAHYVLNELPSNERNNILDRSLLRRSQIKKELSDEQRAIAVAKNMSAVQSDVLPQQTNLTSKERLENMPSSLNRGIEREA